MAVDPMQTNPLVLLVQKARESCAWKRGPPLLMIQHLLACSPRCPELRILFLSVESSRNTPKSWPGGSLIKAIEPR